MSVSGEMKEVLEMEKRFLNRQKGEVNILDRLRLRRKILALHQVMMEILLKQPDEDEAMASEEGTQSIDEATMESDCEETPLIQWSDDESVAMCLRCGFTWDGYAQHVQCDE